MNTLVYAINEIKRKIPYEVLHAAMYIDEDPQIANLTTLEEKIDRKILKRRVLIDANIVGGIEMIIPLNNVPPSYYEDYYTVYRIPNELTNDKEIVSALSLTFIPSNGYYGAQGMQPGAVPGVQSYNEIGMGNWNPLMGLADKVGGAAYGSGVLSQAHLELVGYNMILVYAHYRTLSNFGVRVVVENSNNLSNIQPRSYKDFSKLCVLGTKAYIYNKLIIPLNSGALQGGRELGVFASIVESYESAEEDYDVFLEEVWSKVAWMNDTTRYNRYLNSMFPLDL